MQVGVEIDDEASCFVIIKRRNAYQNQGAVELNESKGIISL